MLHPIMYRSHRLLSAALPALLVTIALAAPADDDLFSSKPGAKPTAPVTKLTPGELPAVVTATRVATGEGGVETWQLGGVGDSLREVTFLKQRYALGTTRGGLLFSADGQRWETAQLPARESVRQILHDDEVWVVTTERNAPYLHFSADGKRWTSNPVWKFSSERLAVHHGLFWAAGDILGTFGVCFSARLDGKTADKLPIWDGKVPSGVDPTVALQSGGRFFLVKPNGELLTSDNGEYWSVEIPDSSLNRANGAFLAEGNNRAVLILLINSRVKDRQLMIRAQEGADGAWLVARDVPFAHARGLAYGGGRFVTIGTTSAGQFKDTALYESVDGLAWTRVAALDADVTGVAFGPAGFVLCGPMGKFYVYQPSALPEKPALVRAATPVPPIRVKDFGRNYSGKGKYRKETGPQTPEQHRVRDLDNLLPKALNGDAAAKRELAMAAIEGRYVEKNPWMAEKWLQEAAAAGDPIAPRGYAMLLELWKPATPPATLAGLYRQSAERGDIPAMVWMVEGRLGAGVVPESERMKWAVEAAPKDAAFAKREEHRADYAANLARAEAGEAQACYVVAKLLVDGDGLTRDVAKAEAFLRKAIDQKHPESMLLQAVLLEQKAGTGEFASQEVAAEFRRLLSAAADAGSRDAMIRLAGYLAEGKRSFTKDEPRAYGVHVKLAESGYVPSMAIVGRVLYTGTLAPKDEAAGLAWIRKGAEANDRNAKLMLAEIEKLAARAAERPPLDAKVNGVTPEVFAALQAIQIAPVASFDDATIKILFDAVWHDAGYSALDEDLAQELAASTRPVVVTAADGQTMNFTKTILPQQQGNFSQIFPVTFQSSNLQYYFVLWQRTGNAGLLVGASQVSKEAHGAVANALAKALYESAIKDSAKPAPELVQYIAHFKTGHDAASPAVQKEYRALIRSALETAKLAAGRVNNTQLNGFSSVPWLKEPAAVTP